MKGLVVGPKAWAYILVWVLPEDSKTKIKEQVAYLEIILGNINKGVRKWGKEGGVVSGDCITQDVTIMGNWWPLGDHKEYISEKAQWWGKETESFIYQTPICY